MDKKSFLLLIFLILFVLLLSSCKKSNDSVDTVKETKSRCPICHTFVDNSSQIIRRPMAVMVENSTEARPQSGLNDACVVYEAITEGGISRFMAVYLHNDCEVIGPVRSARPHFINLAKNYGAVYVHCGQSIEAMNILRGENGFLDMNEMGNNEYFWRVKGRKVPHNLYTSTANVEKYLIGSNKERGEGIFPNFSYDSLLVSGQKVTEFSVDLSKATPKVIWKYDDKTKDYFRYNGNREHKDRGSGEPLSAKNIIVQYVSSYPIQSSTVGTMSVGVNGNGGGYLYSNGMRSEIRWENKISDNTTNFETVSGDLLPMAEGRTYVMFVDSSGSTKTIVQ